MRRGGWLVSLLGGVWVAVPGSAGGQAATPASKAQVMSVVTGHVYLGDTNGPARLATVLLEPASAVDGFTEGAAGKRPGSDGVSAHLEGVQTLLDGSFTVPRVAPGTYYVFATAPGYVSPLAELAATHDELHKPSKELKQQMREALPQVRVQANLPAAIDVTLQRGGAVSGTVLYDDSSPAAGLEVKLLVKKKGKVEPGGETWIAPESSPLGGEGLHATTDDRGVYRMEGLSGGQQGREYLLRVELSVKREHYDISGGGMSVSDDDFMIPVYGGSKLRPADAVPFVLKTGEERPGEDLTVPLAKLHSLSGSIVAAKDGHAVNSGTVTLLYADDRSTAATAHLEHGETSWTMSFVPEGDYLLRASGAADDVFEEVPYPAGTMPPTHTESKTVHSYGEGEMPVHIAGDVESVAVSVPEPGTKKAAAGSQ